MIYCLPIWDVFAPQRGRDGAGEQMTMHFRSPAILIRQAVPVGLPQAQDCSWAIGLSFSWRKNCVLMDTTYLHLFKPFTGVRRGRTGGLHAIDLDDVPIYLNYLISDNKFLISYVSLSCIFCLPLW